MDRLVSSDHLSDTAVLKLTPEDEENDTEIERERESKKHRAWVFWDGNNVEAAAGGVPEVARTHAQGKYQARRVD